MWGMGTRGEEKEEGGGGDLKSKTNESTESSYGNDRKKREREINSSGVHKTQNLIIEL